MNEKNFDVVIIGAGLIGLLTALTLSKKRLNVAIIDKFQFSNNNHLLDLRTTAIAEGSKNFLDTLEIWKKLKIYASPIKKIMVVDRKKFNNIDFINPKEKSFLGYIIENKYIKKIFIDELLSKHNIKFFENEDLQTIENTNDSIIARTAKNSFISQILIAADGKNSFVRKITKTNFFEKKYKYKSFVANIVHEKNHDNIAYEIFYKSGPLAILPMVKNKKNKFCSSIVWSHDSQYVDSLAKISEDYLKLILDEKIKKYIGKTKKILNKKSFSFSAHINTSFYGNRLIFIGDAAHSIHPIAGQGWNLGVRDIEKLLDSINETLNLGLDIGSDYTCKNYHNKCFQDAFALYQITDKLNSIFLLDNFFVESFRNIGFEIIKKNIKINNFISSFAMGDRASLSVLFKS